MLTIRSALAGLLRRKIILLAGLIAASYLFSSQTASALPPSPGKIPNGAKYDCLSCHIAGSYVADTQMKLDFLHASPTKTWTIALAATDSDGDGFTNGDELQDPAGAWVMGNPNPGSAANVSNPSQIDSQPPTPQFTFNGVSGGTTLTGKVSISLNVVAANPTDITRVEFALLAFGGQVVYSATDTSAPFCLVPDCTAWDSASVPSGVYSIQAISYDKRSAAAGGPRTTYRSAGIYIDNPEPVSVEFSAKNYSVSEGAAKATATVELSDPASQPVTVAYALGGGSATPGGDYAPASGTLTFDPGQTSKTFEIAIVDDATPEPAETLNLTLSNPSNAVLGSRATATLTISDDDQSIVSVSASDASAAEAGLDTGTFTITRSGGTGTALTILYSVSGSASKGSDYTALANSVVIPAGATSANITLTPHDDTAVEGSETVTLKLKADAAYGIGAPNSATITIADDDSNTQTVGIASSGTGAAEADPSGSTITITRSGNPASALTVFYSIAGSATAGLDFVALPGSVTIPAGQSSATITIAPLDDAAVEGDETVIVALLPQTGYVIEEPSSASVLIADDDSAATPGPGPNPQPQPAPQHTIYLPGIVR